MNSTSTHYMSRRADLTLAAHIFLWPTLLVMLFLLWCYLRGFDASMCEAYGQCGWRHG